MTFPHPSPSNQSKSTYNEYMSEYHSLQEALFERFQVVKKTGGVNSPFNEAVNRVKETIKDQDWTFSRWCGYLRNIPAIEIQGMIAIAEKNKNPGRHFHWLVKEYKKAQKNIQHVEN